MRHCIIRFAEIQYRGVDLPVLFKVVQEISCVSFASLQSLGSSSVSVDFWKIAVTAGVISSAHSCKTLFGSSSDPAALLTLTSRSSFGGYLLPLVLRYLV